MLSDNVLPIYLCVFIILKASFTIDFSFYLSCFNVCQYVTYSVTNNDKCEEFKAVTLDRCHIPCNKKKTT